MPTSVARWVAVVAMTSASRESAGCPAAGAGPTPTPDLQMRSSANQVPIISSRGVRRRRPRENEVQAVEVDRLGQQAGEAGLLAQPARLLVAVPAQRHQ